MWPLISSFFLLWSRPSRHILWNAFSRSRKTAVVYPLLFIDLRVSPARRMMWSSQLQFCPKLIWNLLNKHFSSTHPRRRVEIIFHETRRTFLASTQAWWQNASSLLAIDLCSRWRYKIYVPRLCGYEEVFFYDFAGYSIQSRRWVFLESTNSCR